MLAVGPKSLFSVHCNVFGALWSHFISCRHLFRPFAHLYIEVEHVVLIIMLCFLVRGSRFWTLKLYRSLVSMELLLSVVPGWHYITYFCWQVCFWASFCNNVYFASSWLGLEFDVLSFVQFFPLWKLLCLPCWFSLVLWLIFVAPNVYSSLHIALCDKV